MQHVLKKIVMAEVSKASMWYPAVQPILDPLENVCVENA